MSQDPVQTWKPTNEWCPGRTGTASAGYGVKCVETGEIGLCKTTYIANEKICSDLARAIDVPVPEVRLGRLEGQAGIIAISIAHGPVSMDVALLRGRDAAIFKSGAVQAAIQAASGVLALHAWVENRDVKEDHLVITERGPGRFDVAAIDFSYALHYSAEFYQPRANLASVPQALATPDKSVLEGVVRRIEGCDDATIDEIVGRLPDEVLSPDDRVKIASALKTRRGLVREALQRAGLL